MTPTATPRPDSRVASLQVRENSQNERPYAQALAVLDGLPFSAALVDGRGTIVGVNAAWRQFGVDNGAESSAFVGESYFGVCAGQSAELDSDGARVAAGLGAALAGRLPRFVYKYACHSPTQQSWFQLIIAPSTMDGRRLALVMHMDVTAEHENQSLLTRALGQAQQLPHAWAQYFAGLSHDLRNPINAINGYVELLRLQLGEAAPAHVIGYLDTLAEAGEELGNMVTRSLATLASEAPLYTVREAAIDVARLVGARLERFAPAAAERGMRLTMRIEPSLPDLMGDEIMLRSIIDNLLSNAIKYAGGGAAVVVSARRDGDDRIRIEVRDNGVGVAEAPVPHCPASGIGSVGAGLGLALVWAMVGARGAEFHFESTPGAGTAAVLLFPAERSRPQLVGQSG